jgi:hypothetical protein
MTAWRHGVDHMKRTRKTKKVDHAAIKAVEGALSTQAMLATLRTASSLDEFILENRDAFLEGNIRKHFEMLIAAHGVKKSEAIERSNIERGYAYQILRGTRDASRDKYIRLAIGIGLTLEETQQLLTVARLGILYSKVLRDAILIFGIVNRLGILTIECLLEEQGVEPLV